jgi:hypothetical protein
MLNKVDAFSNINRQKLLRASSRALMEWNASHSSVCCGCGCGFSHVLWKGGREQSSKEASLSLKALSILCRHLRTGSACNTLLDK